MTTTVPKFLISEGLPRAHYIEDAVARFQRVQEMGGLSGGLDNYVDGAARRIGAFDRKRDALALLVEAQDYELAGPLLTRDAGRLNDKAFDIRSKECSVHNLEHV